MAVMIPGRRRKKPAPAPGPVVEEIEPVVPAPSPADVLRAAQEAREAASREHTDLRRRYVEGHSVTISSIDAAERRLRVAELDVERAQTGHAVALEEGRCDAWAQTLESHAAAFDDPLPGLMAALAALDPEVAAFKAKLEATVNQALASVEAHNSSVTALAHLVRSGELSPYSDGSTAFGSSVAVDGRSGTVVDGNAIVDRWLESVLPDREFLLAWLERRRIARELGRP
ncbi:hypothetical protein [Sinomonas albida]|uniref:hypothetical protein n=1 Tax=Sinomonas albida TaxID=369942 RepID=UPI00301907B2